MRGIKIRLAVGFASFTIRVPQVPSAGDLIRYQGISYRVSKVEWLVDEGGVRLIRVSAQTR